MKAGSDRVDVLWCVTGFLSTVVYFCDLLDLSLFFARTRIRIRMITPPYTC